MNTTTKRGTYHAPCVEICHLLELGNLLRELSNSGEFEGIYLEDEVYE